MYLYTYLHKFIQFMHKNKKVKWHADKDFTEFWH